MNLPSFLSYLYPQTIVQISSPYNPLIRVNLESGEYKLLVNGSKQSGREIRKLWRYAIEKLSVKDVGNVDEIAIFGIGGGTVMHVLHGMYPEAHMVGVDIDPVIISLGRKYFGLDTLPLAIVAADAARFVKTKHAGRYDLMVLDLFVGADIPSFVETEEFLTNVKRLLRPKGALLINYLREEAFIARVNNLERTLRTLFSHVTHVDRRYNRFFFAR